jgi:hypothetical protein
MNTIKYHELNMKFMLTILLQRGGVGIPIDFISHPAFYRFAR